VNRVTRDPSHDRDDRPLIGEVARSLRSLSTEIDRLDQVAAERYGLNRTDMRGLDLVGQLGPIAPTSLARQLGFTTGGITSVIDRLEKAGYVRRLPDPRDRRRLLLERTQATAERDQEVFGPMEEAIAKRLARFTDRELEVIRTFLVETRAIIARSSAELAGEAVKSDRGPGHPTRAGTKSGGNR
jgi:DNA-binding MarR family transcriptional regulator